MRVKDAERILNVSRATVHNWIKSGKLRLNKTLRNGYRDIDEESVYECVASTYEPDSRINRVLAVCEDGRALKFFPDRPTFDRVIAYLTEMDKTQASIERKEPV